VLLAGAGCTSARLLVRGHECTVGRRADSQKVAARVLRVAPTQRRPAQHCVRAVTYTAPTTTDTAVGLSPSHPARPLASRLATSRVSAPFSSATRWLSQQPPPRLLQTLLCRAMQEFHRGQLVGAVQAPSSTRKATRSVRPAKNRNQHAATCNMQHATYSMQHVVCCRPAQPAVPPSAPAADLAAASWGACWCWCWLCWLREPMRQSPMRQCAMCNTVHPPAQRSGRAKGAPACSLPPRGLPALRHPGLPGFPGK
jgi:hypothetical protein